MPQNSNGRTHEVCVAADGTVIVFAQCRDGILHYDQQGRLISRYGGDNWLGAHGLTYRSDREGEFLWLTDENSGLVAKTTLTGEILTEYKPPDESVSQTRDGTDSKDRPHFKPTWVADDPETGTTWVADGYGSSLIYRYDSTGRLVGSISGEESGTRFKCPHGIVVDEKSQLWIADRGNRRIAICNSDGICVQTMNDRCHSPCGFDLSDGLMGAEGDGGMAPEGLGGVSAPVYADAGFMDTSGRRALQPTAFAETFHK